MQSRGGWLEQNGNVLLFGRQFVLQRSQELLAQGFQRIGFGGRNGNYGRSFTWDGITQRPAVQLQQAQIQLWRVGKQETSQQLVGVAQAMMDIGTGVAAFQPFQGQLQRLVTGWQCFTLQRQGGDEIDPPSAAHVDFAFLFGVGVDQDIGL
ncbi:hypothetical protein D3C80_1334890 [compost metagenome]